MTTTNDITGDALVNNKGDRGKISDNWPWPDPFEERMRIKRDEEASRKKDAK